MALRRERGARRGRVARGRGAFVALACALYLGGGVVVTWPAVLHARTDFLSGGAPGHGEASAGDHLQTLYHYWLVGHQLEDGHAPWRDPYTFRPEAGPVPNYPGWPFGFLFWPLEAAFGPVAGWNLLQLVLYALAGLAALAWLRELGLPRGPALAGGLAFAIAPYRAAQSVGHLLGPISLLLPVALWAFERARRGSRVWFVASAAALASIPLSGQVHLALGATPFFALYALCRTRSRPLLGGAALAAAAAVGAGLLVRQTVIVGSFRSGGRSLTEVGFYSARVGDFLSRHVDHARSEQFAYLGWATPLVALVGLAVLVRERRFALALALAVGALVPMLLALGTRLPLYSVLWHALPPFRFPRVPERLLPIACLALAALVAFALARASARATIVVVPLALLLLFVDLRVRIYGRSVADADNRAYAALRRAPPGRLLELPVFLPDVHYGSVYLWYDTIALRERPGGYSTTAPREAKATAQRLERLNCGDWSGRTDFVLEQIGVRTITFHRGLFERNSAVPDRSWFAWRGLVRHGFQPSARDGAVTAFVRGAGRAGAARPPTREPRRDRPLFCQGWYGDTGTGRFMSERHAPFWVYGGGTLRLRLAPSPLARRFTVDERPRRGPDLVLGRRGWHLVTIDVPHLVAAAGARVGLRLASLATSPSRGSRSRRTGSSP